MRTLYHVEELSTEEKNEWINAINERRKKFIYRLDAQCWKRLQLSNME